MNARLGMAAIEQSGPSFSLSEPVVCRVCLSIQISVRLILGGRSNGFHVMPVKNGSVLLL